MKVTGEVEEFLGGAGAGKSGGREEIEGGTPESVEDGTPESVECRGFLIGDMF